MDNRWLMAGIVLVGVPLVIIGYIVLTERVLRLLPATRRDGIRPWLWLAPALLFVGVFLIYPTIRTVVISFMDARSENFIGIENYVEFFGNDRNCTVFINNLLWIVFFTLMGALNLYVAYNFAESVWVNFKLYGRIGLTLLFALAQGAWLASKIQPENP